MPCSPRLCLALLLVLASALPLRAGEPAAASALDLVPADASAFVHVRLGDLWKSKLLAEYRTTFQKAGKNVLTAFDRRFLALPSNLDQLTGFVVLGDRQPKAMMVIVTTTKPLEQRALLKRLLPEAVEEEQGDGKVWKDARRNTEVVFLSERSVAVGLPGTAAFLRRKPAREGALSEAIELARGKALVLALNPQALPPQALKDTPPAFQPLLKARLMTLVLETEKKAMLAFRLSYADAEQAGAAEAAARQGIELARKALDHNRRELEHKALADGQPGEPQEFAEAAASVFGLGMLNRLDEYLAALPLTKDENALRLTLHLPEAGVSTLGTAAVGTALLVPAMQKVRNAAARVQSTNNLKQIGLAMHNYNDVYRKLPAAAICDKEGKPLLSWRVAILPYLEENELYRQFKLDEPWDSDHNRPLIAKMPPVYLLPSARDRPSETYYRVFVGGGAGFEMRKALRFADITDGMSTTILAIEAAESVPWTKPDELVYDAQRALPRFGRFHGNVMNAVLFDASVRILPGSLPERTLRALITRAGGEVIDTQSLYGR